MGRCRTRARSSRTARPRHRCSPTGRRRILSAGWTPASRPDSRSPWPRLAATGSPRWSAEVKPAGCGWTSRSKPEAWRPLLRHRARGLRPLDDLVEQDSCFRWSRDHEVAVVEEVRRRFRRAHPYAHVRDVQRTHILEHRAVVLVVSTAHDENDRSMFEYVSSLDIPHMCVGVSSPEAPAHLFDHCDLVVSGPSEAAVLLNEIVEWADTASSMAHAGPPRLRL